MTVLLGCIADDFTGATDLASMLTRGGMRTVQVIDVPAPDDPVPDAEAIVVALKSRTIPAQEAVAPVARRLPLAEGAGARQFFFKYCSTFDLTDQGNIGPVADALLAELGADFSIVCPAYPENGRTIYLGHLFVGQQLLSDSPMRHHPLTPMTDSNLVRVMGRQTRGQSRTRGTADNSRRIIGNRGGVRQVAGARACAMRCAMRWPKSDLDRDRPLLRHGSRLSPAVPGSHWACLTISEGAGLLGQSDAERAIAARRRRCRCSGRKLFGSDAAPGRGYAEVSSSLQT